MRERIKVGETYFLVRDPKWKVTVTRIEEKPMFMSEPMIYVDQTNGKSFFSLSGFKRIFKATTEGVKDE